MKILKRGKVKNEHPKMTCAYCDTIFEYLKMTCAYCDTVFEYLKTDIDFDRDGRYVVCPVCGKFLNVN